MSFRNRSRPRKNHGTCKYCRLNIFSKRKTSRLGFCTDNCLRSWQMVHDLLPWNPSTDEIKRKYALYGGSMYTTIRWINLRKVVLEKHGHICAKCGSGESLHVDHIKPVSWGIGSYWKADNLQILCRKCNLEKGARNSLDYRKKEASFDSFMDEF